ncbi:MAG TPA: hypothetical protein VHS96_04395, partial [Bacteroidia bacterium]|nr:hypothetical protein [Bacteroidia bacterium]
GYKVGAYLDLETPIATALPAILTTAGTEGHVCAFKLNHHGSRESTNDSLLKTMKPTFAAISCGNRHDHPNQEALDRLQETTWTKTANYFNQGLQRYVLTELRLQRFIIEKIGMTSGNIGYVVPLSLAPPKTIVKKKTSMPSRTKNKRKIIRSALYELKSQSTVAGDFIIKVFEENNSKQSIADVSAFSLVVSNYATVQSIDAGTFNCHKK